jgi:hypothetical protein
MTTMPCAVSHCDTPAAHIVQTNFTYYVNKQGPGPGTRWVAETENIMLYLCHDHHFMWRQRGSTLTKKGVLI